MNSESEMDGWRGVINRLKKQWKELSSESKTVLAVTADSACRTSLRTLSIEEGWRVLFADSVENGLRLQEGNRVCVLVYDRNLSGMDWREGLRALTATNDAAIPILLSDSLPPRLRCEVLRCGGYDIAANPVAARSLAALVNGAIGLQRSIDSLEVDDSQ
jgi:DNA-binding response OmpR family regulator